MKQTMFFNAEYYHKFDAKNARFCWGVTEFDLTRDIKAQIAEIIKQECEDVLVSSINLKAFNAVGN
jgi:hypothetical protein